MHVCVYVFLSCEIDLVMFLQIVILRSRLKNAQKFGL